MSDQARKALFNFREVAHLPSRDGRKLVANKLFRTGNISHVEEDTAVHLREDLNITTYIDLRGRKEINEFGEPRALMAAGIEWLSLDINSHDAEFESVARPAVKDWFELYVRFFKRHTRSWVKFLESVLDSKNGIAYGCMFGKDRTGIATSFLLHILDVHDEHIQKDYSLTTGMMEPRFYNRFITFFDDSPLSEQEIFHHYLTAHPEIMTGFTDYLRRQDDEMRELLDKAGFTASLADQLRQKLLI